MSIAPPGPRRPDHQPSTPTEGSPGIIGAATKGAASAIEDDGHHEFKSVQALRGRERGARAKWEGQGWELVAESQGTLRTELRFRRAKPRTVGARFASIVSDFRRLQPQTRLVSIASCVLVLAASIVGMVAVAQGGGEALEPSPAQTASPTPAPAPASAQTASPAPAPAEAPAQTAAPSPAPAQATVADSSVDELLDKLNSPDMGGIRVGDQFRLTAELFESDAWGVGASEAFSVMLKAKGGADDLSVFVDESAAAAWQDGTQVEMVVEMVEVRIDGETTAGWLEAQSVETISGAVTG